MLGQTRLGCEVRIAKGGSHAMRITKMSVGQFAAFLIRFHSHFPLLQKFIFDSNVVIRNSEDGNSVRTNDVLFVVVLGIEQFFL